MHSQGFHFHDAPPFSCLLIEVLNAVFHSIQLSIGHLGRFFAEGPGLEQTDDGPSETSRISTITSLKWSCTAGMF